MDRMRFLLTLTVLLTLVSTGYPAAARAAERPSEPALDDWSFLPTDVIGALSFRRAHPEWDGRGAVIGVMDTGVDLGTEGLLTTPDGKIKILDARDFSGAGDVSWTTATLDTVDGRPSLEDAEGRRVFGVADLPVAPADGVYRLGFLREKQYQNTPIFDLNDNGRTGERFAVLAVPTRVEASDSDWVALVDLDGDGNLDDETPVRSYRYDHQTLRFRSNTDEAKLHRETGCLTILPGEKKVEFHFPGGAHATHVAGIAAGYRLGGTEGYDGVAPGAQVLSLKIGMNSLSGGATTTGSVTRALEFGADWAKEHGRPVVFNMSYGIGSEIEGHSRIDAFVDSFLVAHPHLIFVTSAGNDGPGLSTVGTPGAGAFAFAAGALFVKSTSRDLYGGSLERNLPFHFSSRGGDTAKPDALAPGAAASSVPPYAGGNVMWGTSMASPQAAGAMALLVSAASAEGAPWSWAVLEQAVRGTAEPLSGFTALDQGAGVIQVPEAWKALRGLGGRVDSPLLAYHVTADGPIPSGATPLAAYWRTGGVFPEPPHGVKVTVSPAFAEAATPDERNGSYRAFTLRSDAPWLRADRSETYLQGAHDQSFTVFYDPDRLREPGLYVGRVRAFAKGAPGPRVPEWESWHTVIVPYELDAEKGYERKWTGDDLEPGGARRFFLRLPPGASSLALDLRIPEGEHGKARLMVFDPQGRSTGGYRGWADDAEDTRDVLVIDGETLRPGIWEADVVASYRNRFSSAWAFTAQAEGYRSDPDTVRAFTLPQGDAPAARVTVTSLFDRRFRGRGEGQVAGYRREREVTVRGTSVWTEAFKLNAELARAEFHFEMSPETYDLLTDCAVRVLDADGKAVVNTGFDQRLLDFSFANPSPEEAEPVTYTLQVWAGFASAASDTSWGFHLRESYVRRAADRVRVTHQGHEVFDLWPDGPVELTLTLARAPRQAPDGTINYGEVRFVDDKEKRTRFVLPIRLSRGR
jgi:tripeptidyl-peptidase-2